MKSHSNAASSQLLAVLVGLCLAGIAGCGQERIASVAGKVVWIDGQDATELAGYTVTFESMEAKVGATGVVQSDATFTVDTERPGDGALLGKHRVALTPPNPLHDIDRPRPKAILPVRYGDLNASKLEATVEPGKVNQVVLTVDRK
jgi:hypothetical protein